MTRVARLSPATWTELFMQNSDNLVREIEFWGNRLGEFRRALETGDPRLPETLLSEGSERKKTLEKSYQRFVRDEENQS